MDIFITFYLFILGTLFGSFASVIINRLRNHQNGIFTGRSECPKCKHTLGAKDLIPIASYLSTKGKCRYCKSKISPLYPILEICTGLLFSFTGIFLIDYNLLLMGNGLEIYKLIFFLLFGFLTIVYVFYDILYLEIPDSILGILIGITFISISIQSFVPNFQIIQSLPGYNLDISHGILYGCVGFGICMIASFYFIFFKGLKEIYDILIVSIFGIGLLYIKFYLGIHIEETALGSALIGSYLVFLFLFLQVTVSGGTWMGAGDLRIAILMGFISGLFLSFHTLLVAYFSGSIIGIGVIIFMKTRHYYQEKKKILTKIKRILGMTESKVKLDTHLPFGPFLAIGIYGVLFFGDTLSELLNYL